MPRYANVSCSNCGEDFGAGDNGFSHCESHAGKPRVLNAPPRPVLTSEQMEAEAIAFDFAYNADKDSDGRNQRLQAQAMRLQTADQRAVLASGLWA